MAKKSKSVSQVIPPATEPPNGHAAPPARASDQGYAEVLVHELLGFKHHWRHQQSYKTRGDAFRQLALIDYGKLSELLIAWMRDEGIVLGAAYHAQDDTRAEIIGRLAASIQTSWTDTAYVILPKTAANELLYALTALDEGEVSDLVAPNPSPTRKPSRRNTLRIRQLRAHAVDFFRFYQCRGDTSKPALHRIAAAFGTTDANVKNWLHGKAEVYEPDPEDRWFAFFAGHVASGKSFEDSLAMAGEQLGDGYDLDKMRALAGPYLTMPRSLIEEYYSDENLNAIGAAYRQAIGK